MPVKNWILGFTPNDRKIIGEDIKMVEFGWPMGMPTVKPIGNRLFEVRSDLADGSNARILFTIFKSHMILLHGYIKKTNKIPSRELKLAKNRLKKFYQSQQS